MVALWNRADHYIFALWFLSVFFPRLISAAADWMSTILQEVRWLRWARTQEMPSTFTPKS